MWHYVFQVTRGTIIGHGGYKSEDAARKRYERVRGGEVYLYSTTEGSLKKAIQEFKVNRFGGRR